MLKKLLDIFKERNIKKPDFWLAYENSIDKNLKEFPLKDINFVVLDTETTGFNYETDRILSIGAVTIKNNRIDTKNTFEKYIDQKTFNPETVAIHGIIKNSKYDKEDELEVLKEFLIYCQNSVLVAHHAYFDINMINMALQRHHLPKLKNRYLDTGYYFKKTKAINQLLKNDKNYSLDEVCDELNITIKDRHTAVGDAYLTAIAFQKILHRLNFKPTSSLKKLLRK